MDVSALQNERIDATLARFEIARLKALSVGFDIPNFRIEPLLRAPRIGPRTASQMLQPLNHQMPKTHW